VSAFLAGKFHAGRALFRRNAVGRAAFSAGGVDAGIALLHDKGASGALRFVICRLATICGVSAGMRFHTAVNKFCWQAVMGQPLTVWRTAMDQKRPYLYLGDAVRAVTFILTERAFDGRVYNVVTDNASVRQLVDYIRPHVPDVTVEYVDTPIMNQLSYEVSNARFRKLGFEVSGTLEAGIGETIRLFGGLATRGR